MQVVKLKCELCGAEIAKSQMPKHLRRHEKHPETFKETSYALTHEGLNCQFCNKLCKNRNSLCNHERLCKENPNRQIPPDGFSEYNKKLKSGEVEIWNKGKTAETDERVAKQQKSMLCYYESHEGTFKGKKHSEESKKLIGKGVKKFLEDNPDMVPYKRNHSSRASYPEIYFSKIFKDEGFNLFEQFSFKSYRLDFCDPVKKIDIEIDGEQHYVVPAMIEHDERRNNVLTDNGWTVYRIRWSDYKKMTPEEQINLINNIRELLRT